MDLQALWQASLGELELSLTKANFTTWFKSTYLAQAEGTKAIVCVPNTFTQAWLQKKYNDQIIRALRNASNLPIREIAYRVEVKNTTQIAIDAANAPSSSGMYSESSQAFAAEQPTSAATNTHSNSDIGLNPRYVFNSFIVGKGNELAHAACQAVAGKAGEVYNPLFIHGDAGMGKTHLVQAIGHHVLQTNPNAKVRYVSCERFANEFIQSVRSGRMNEFKDRYRLVDVLLIDDIQFLQGKEGTQEEFFHTFNALHQANKQIVITSDRPPKDIQTLESRLQSRFEWGMMADISKPDFETRVAILQAKTREKNYPLSIDLLHTIAGSIQSNIRELEGALNKIIAYHQFKNIPPTLESIQPLLQSFTPTITKRSITPKLLLETVNTYFDITMDEMVGKSREKRLAHPRQIAMYMLREEIKCSYPAIGDQVGGRDHTTAMHACEKITNLIKTDEQLKQDITLLREKIYNQSH
jgi:chromosomal replication initiator protein